MSRDDGRGWRLPGVDAATVRAVAGRHRLDLLTAAVLARRGVTAPAEVDAFLGRGRLPPSPIDGMQAAVARLRRCRGQQVCVFGDPDVDGIAAAAILVELLRRLGARVRWRIPPGGRHDLGADGLRAAEQAGAALIVRVDGAVTAPEAAQAARIGCDVLVVDHHPPLDAIPDSVLMLNPAIAAPDGSHGLAAAAVALRLAEAVRAATGGEELPYDLAALATLADRMPLTGESRRITARGLDMIAAGGRPGLQELWIRVGRSAPAPTADRVGRLLNPVLGSAARYGRGDHAVELLVSRERARCQELTGLLQELDARRRRESAAAWSRLLPAARRAAREHPHARCLVVDDQDLARGLTGSLAHRLSRFLKRPMAVVACDDGAISGSIRIPDDGADALRLLAQADGLLTRRGGHRRAAGFVAAASALAALRRRWSGLPGADAGARGGSPPERLLDAEVPVGALTPALDRLIVAFEPTGTGAGPVVFRTRGLPVVDVSLFGRASEHCKLLLDAGAYRWPALYWGAAAAVGGRIVPGDRVDVVYRLEPDHADGQRRLRMVVLDLWQAV